MQELLKLNETFCRALLPTSATSPSINLFDSSNTLSRTLSPTSASPTGSYEHLPIAAQYASTATPTDECADTLPPAGLTPNIGSRLAAYQALTNGRPSRKSSFRTLSGNTHSHKSMPPPSRSAIDPSGSSFSASLNRTSYLPRISSQSSASAVPIGGVQLPEELGKVLTVLAGGILEGHIKLTNALRRRYEDQYPLVRSLADVFTSHVSVT